MLLVLQTLMTPVVGAVSIWGFYRSRKDGAVVGYLSIVGLIMAGLSVATLTT